MKIFVDIPKAHLKELAQLAKARRCSRDALIRDAVAAYLERERAFKAAFGLWGDRTVDGLEYQRKIRDEW